jgi:ABC-type glycerol-3-phosphate transport system substrate-binding protein
MGGCRRAPNPATETAIFTFTPSPTIEAPYPGLPTEASYPTATNPELNPPTFTPNLPAYPAPLTTTPLPPTLPPPAPTAQPSPTPQGYSPSSTPTRYIPTAYPAPPTSPVSTIGFTPGYPGPPTSIPPPIFTQGAYPAPTTPVQVFTRTPARSPTATVTPNRSQTSYPTPTPGTYTPGPSPTERPPRPPSSPPPPGSVVTIWHSWDDTETQALVTVIQSFQHLYPDVVFDVLYVPLDDLRNTYENAAYNGRGPSLLLAPADWGPALYDSNLITDLYPYTPPDYLNNINPPALASGQYQNALISLPLSQHGVVMFRNTALIQNAPQTFDELITAAQRATRAGNIGSYLERGAFFSTANITGLGGSIMDEGYNPAFNDSFGLEWLDLLTAFDEAGAVTFNTNRDLDMFKLGRVGLIIDGTWNIYNLSQAIGSENLAINPWPTYGTGHLSGWVQSDSVYLNINSTGDDRFAALSFIGYLLDPNVQQVLAEVGHIPSVITTQPRDIIIQQAMSAFSNGIPYPITSDNRILTAYWDELDLAIQSVFERGANPATALQAASDAITQRLEELRGVP